MKLINLLEVPEIKRNIESGWRTDENRKIAKKYDKEFFDGDRVNGYGGYFYDGRWQKVAEKIKNVYHLNSESSVLDIGCAKGFLLFDLQEKIPGIHIAGIDISEYAINKTLDGYGKYMYDKFGDDNDAASAHYYDEVLENQMRKKILPHLIIGDSKNLPWPDNSFDLVLNINTLHNLKEENCIKGINEMNRVSKNPEKIFIQVDAYRNDEEKKRMEEWVLTAETMKCDKDWIEFFKETGYNGNYFWTIV